MIWLYDRSGNPVGAATQLGQGETVLAVPSDAYSAAIQGPEGWSATEPLAGVAGTKERLEIGNRSALIRGFSQAFNWYSGPYDLDFKAMAE